MRDWKGPYGRVTLEISHSTALDDQYDVIDLMARLLCLEEAHRNVGQKERAKGQRGNI